MQRRLGEDAQPEIGQIGAPDGNGTGATHALDRRRIGRRNGLGEGDDGVGGGRTGEVDVLLHGHRHPVQRAERRAGRNSLVGGISGGQRLSVEAAHHSVEPRVHLVDASQMGLDDLTARHLPTGDHACQFNRTAAPQLVAHNGRSPVAFLVVP